MLFKNNNNKNNCDESSLRNKKQEGETRFGFQSIEIGVPRLRGKRKRFVVGWICAYTRDRGNAGVRSSLLIFTSTPRYFVCARDRDLVRFRGDGRYFFKKKKKKKYIYSRMLAERFLKVIEIGKFWLGLDQWFPICGSSVDE